jgi:hypothetical protein
MKENDDDFQEKNIRKKQDKKLAKHFDIYINNQKFKVINYLFKENRGDRTGKYIHLISKFDIQISQTQNVKIVIFENQTRIEINGDWAFASWGVGNYNVGYWINNLVREQRTSANNG